MNRSVVAVNSRKAPANNSYVRVFSLFFQIRYCPRRSAAQTRAFRLSHVFARAASILFPATLLFSSANVFAQADFNIQPLGVASNPQNVTVALSTPGIVASVQVLTLGAPGLDFALSGVGTCIAATFPGNCTVSVSFTPAAPGLRLGAIILMDADQQTVLGTASLQGTGSGGLGVLIPGNIVPIAGDGEGKSFPVLDGISAQTAELDQPASVALDGLGNLYIADVYHHRIRMVCGRASVPSSTAPPARRPRPASSPPSPATAHRLIPAMVV